MRIGSTSTGTNSNREDASKRVWRTERGSEVVWFYFVTMSLGISAALGWFALVEWHNRRQWQRYRQKAVRCGWRRIDHGTHDQQKSIPEQIPDGMGKCLDGDDTKQ